MGKFMDLTGQRFNKLFVIVKEKEKRKGIIQWKCVCDCGNEKITSTVNLRSGKTKSCGCLKKESMSKVGKGNKGKTDKSIIGKRFGKLIVLDTYKKNGENGYITICKCDCGNIKHIRKAPIMEGTTKSCGCLSFSHKMSKTLPYKLWRGIKNRIYNSNLKEFKNYGGRGIGMCEEWRNSFEKFYDYIMKIGYKKGLQIDRIDNDGNYEPGNIRFVTLKENCNNRRSNVNITYRGVTKNIMEWSIILGIKYMTLRARLLKYNWSVEKAFNTPIKGSA